MNMGNDRMNRIKILQQEKLRNQQLRKTGKYADMSLQYTKCDYCKQQVLITTLQHHITYCKSAYKPRTKGNCSACQKFRSK
jgi:hypothetical protein